MKQATVNGLGLKLDYFIDAVRRRDSQLLDLEISNACLKDRIQDLETQLAACQSSEEKNEKTQ